MYERNRNTLISLAVGLLFVVLVVIGISSIGEEEDTLANLVSVTGTGTATLTKG